MKQFKSWLVLAGAVLALAACGGGGGGDDVDPGPGQADPLDGVPAEATQSVSGWIGYLARLIKATEADDREPVASGGARAGVAAGRRRGRAGRAGLSLRVPRIQPQRRRHKRRRFSRFGPRSAGAVETPQERCTTIQSLATHKDWEGHHGYDTANDRYHHRHLIGRALTSRRN